MPELTVLEGHGRGHAVAPGAIVDVPHPDESVRARFARRGAPRLDALIWTGAGAPDAAPEVPGARRYDLVEHIGWLADDPETADPGDVVKQISFLHASDSVSLEEFRTHYRHHVEVARRHMPTLWQYIQYDVTATHAPAGAAADGYLGDGVVAVSVLWFRSTEDFLHRYFASPQDETQFRSQEGFLDLTKAFTFVGSSHPSAAPTARP